MPGPLAVAGTTVRVVRNRTLCRAALTGAAGLFALVAVTGTMVGGTQQASAAPACGNPSALVSDGTSVVGTTGGEAPTTVPRDLLGAEQEANTATIVAVGRQAGVPPRGWQIAVATAIQESRLQNLAYGDRDSLGLFQQRPSQGWGTPEQVTTPGYAAQKFYDALLQVPDWQQMPLTEAAQAVQRSGFPDAYAQWENVASQLVTQAVDGGAADASALIDGAFAQIAQACPTGAGAVEGTGADFPDLDDSAGASVVRTASTQIGVPYSWGGGGPDGPSKGFARGADTVGFDCSSLVQWAYWRSAHLSLPRTSREQYAATTRIDLSQARAGDLLFFATGGTGAVSHVSIYDGSGGVVQAPSTGGHVEHVTDLLTNSWWTSRLVGVGRV